MHAEGIYITVGFVLINTLPELEHNVYNALLNEPRIIEIRPLYNEYDILVKIKTSNNQKFGDFVSDKIRSLEGVIDTKTIQ